MKNTKLKISNRPIKFSDSAASEGSSDKKGGKSSNEPDEPTNINREKQREEAKKKRKIDEKLKKGSHTKKPWEDERSIYSPQSPHLNPKKDKEQEVDDHDEGKNKEDWCRI